MLCCHRYKSRVDGIRFSVMSFVGYDYRKEKNKIDVSWDAIEEFSEGEDTERAQ